MQHTNGKGWAPFTVFGGFLMTCHGQRLWHPPWVGLAAEHGASTSCVVDESTMPSHEALPLCPAACQVLGPASLMEARYLG